MRFCLFPVVLLILAIAGSIATAETVQVKYQGPVVLDTFECSDISRSSLVKRVCYQSGAQYMVIRLRSTYYHYCEIGSGVINDFMEVKSMGRFYNKNIRDSSNGGLYSCRDKIVPKF